MSQDNQIIGFVKWLLKWFFILILGLVLLALGIWGITYAYQYWTHDRHLKKIEVQVFNGSNFIIDGKEAPGPWQKYQDKAKSSDKETPEENPFADLIPEKICSDDMPVYIGYKNGTSKVIEFIEIDFTARFPQHSSNILDWNAELESDLIVPPGQTATYCARLPVKDEYQNHDGLSNAVYESKVARVRFQDE